MDRLRALEKEVSFDTATEGRQRFIDAVRDRQWKRQTNGTRKKVILIRRSV